MIVQVQQAHKEWQEKNFPNSNADEMLFGIMEEVGELTHAHLKEKQGIRTNENLPANAKDAIGDIIIYLMGYCTYRDWSLHNIIGETWRQVSQRDWQENKEIPKDTKFKNTTHIQ